MSDIQEKILELMDLFDEDEVTTADKINRPEPKQSVKEIEFDGENLADSVDELISDTSRLKQVARGDKKPTLKEFVQSKKRKDRAKAISEGGENEMDEVIRRQGEFIENDLVDLDPPDFASGGIARMLGE